MSKSHNKNCKTMLFLSEKCTCGADEEFIKERNILNPINTEKDNEKALATIERLWDAKPNTEDGDILDKLVTLVLAYENKHYPIIPSDTRTFFQEKLFIPYLIPAVFILIILVGLFAG